MEQKKIMLQWMGTSRYVYNRTLDATKKGEKMNFFELRNKYVTAKNNPNIQDWEKITPKDIRAGAIRDMVKNFKTAMSNLKNKNITHFKLRFQSRKKPSSIEIPKSAIKIKDNLLFMFPTFIKDGIKLSKDKSLKNIKIEHDCRLKNDRGRWYLYIPIKTQMDTVIPPNNMCSLDPGIRKFQTLYSEEQTVKFETNKDALRKLQSKLDLFCSLRDKKTVKKNHCNRRIRKLWSRLDNLIDDLHYKTISFLTTTFNTVFLPKFESQELSRKIRFKKCNRDLFSLKHYLFQQRLLEKCRTKTHCQTIICTEEYTSKTCTRCGVLNNNLGSSEIFRCSKCKLTVDRDINGARNILIKNINEFH